MPKEIKELLPEHTARFPEWVEKWKAVGLSTAPANFKVAEVAVREIYKGTKLTPPTHVLHLSSPYAAVIGGVMGLYLRQDEEQPPAKVLKKPVNAYERALCTQVAAQLGVKAPKGKALDNLIGTARDGAQESLSNLSRGQFWAAWGSYVSFFRDVMHWENETLETFALDETLMLNCGYVWWHEDLAIVVDRPKEIHLDGGGRLHSVDGPSLSYRDEWAIYRVHGVEVPKAWIMEKDKLDPTTALNWQNVEQRRAAAEIVGWSKVLAHVNGKVVHEDEFGKLIKADLPGAEGSMFAQVTCGTGRVFCLPVPNTMKTCHEAVAWTYNLDITKYKPEVRT